MKPETRIYIMTDGFMEWLDEAFPDHRRVLNKTQLRTLRAYRAGQYKKAHYNTVDSILISLGSNIKNLPKWLWLDD